MTKPTIVATLTQVSPGGSNEKLIEELYSAYIALYFYTACTNYWSQFYLPDAAEFEGTNGFHQLCKRIVDVSNADFTHMAQILAACDQSRLHANPISHLMSEAQDFWRYHVRSTSDVFVSREKAQSSR
ncbi:MAG: hypothetical protein LAP13_27115 [Acidobacteriia bacterium]|nr:hypothetical protein [Terriglobia bacterium]